jgi:hypothetical protein
MSKDIIEMARQAGWSGIYSQWVSPTERTHLTVPVTMEQIEAFAKLVAAKEREACARVCESLSLEWEEQPDIAQVELATMLDCALAIRARGEAC